ncbi:hypothetical protein PAXINDRAFT_12026 [Paxillus involutus ATCC 200175]|uniref:Uncharacterized protein n=1 Tax=Paxillus involutus ATCC 200175 TaxID=664439 RepID=A0A0C9U7J5_PAXIN|nr:hypothetical protein PAXINDRAFT_12026 [Paxillus involutus ATCC 200175]
MVWDHRNARAPEKATRKACSRCRGGNKMRTYFCRAVKTTWLCAEIHNRRKLLESECWSMKNNTFRIYPSDESETDSAVELCLSAERYVDAILLAIQGGDELL